MGKRRLLQQAFLLACALALTACASRPAPTVTIAPSPSASEPTRTPSPTPGAPPTALDAYQEQRLEMVRSQIERRGVANPQVLEAMRAVPRHRFVPEEWRAQAYADHPLPIGYNQTISQPYVVAWMTELLRVGAGDKVLEIGTGSGYQAAVLAELGCQVYTIEIIEPLSEQAGQRLEELGYEDVVVRQGDGYYGWEDQAPFDGIIVTAAPDHVPPPLVQQLKDGARMVLPVGPPGGYQNLFLITKEEGEVTSESMGGVRFVPFTRE